MLEVNAIDTLFCLPGVQNDPFFDALYDRTNAIRPIHAFAEDPAKRVLVQAIRTGKAPLRLLPPLILHNRSGAKHTAQAEAILRGEADLAF